MNTPPLRLSKLPFYDLKDNLSIQVVKSFLKMPNLHHFKNQTTAPQRWEFSIKAVLLLPCPRRCCGRFVRLLNNGFFPPKILLHSSRNFELSKQYTRIFVAEFKTNRKWLILIVTMDHTEKGWCPLSPHFMASSMVINSWIFKSNLGKWQTKKTKTNPIQTAAKLSSKILRRSLQCWTWRSCSLEWLAEAAAAVTVKTAAAVGSSWPLVLFINSSALFSDKSFKSFEELFFEDPQAGVAGWLLGAVEDRFSCSFSTELLLSLECSKETVLGVLTSLLLLTFKQLFRVSSDETDLEEFCKSWSVVKFVDFDTSLKDSAFSGQFVAAKIVNKWVRYFLQNSCKTDWTLSICKSYV